LKLNKYFINFFFSVPEKTVFFQPKLLSIPSKIVLKADEL